MEVRDQFREDRVPFLVLEVPQVLEKATRVSIANPDSCGPSSRWTGEKSAALPQSFFALRSPSRARAFEYTPPGEYSVNIRRARK